MLKVNKSNTRTRCDICSKLTIKTAERRRWRRSRVLIVNLLLTYFTPCFSAKANTGWQIPGKYRLGSRYKLV